MKAIGFNAGQFGDILMGLVAARAHKEEFPDSHLTLGIAEKYSAVAPLFANNPLVDGIHIWKGYNDWPANEDHIAIAQKGWTKVYNAMPQHTSAFWYLRMHQTAELCLMHGLTPPSNLKIDLTLPVKPLKFGKHIALSLFGETRGQEKSITMKQANYIVSIVEKLGYTPLQLGLVGEPRVCTRYIGTFEDSVKTMLGCDALITVDTAMAWISSGYSFPTLGLYGHEYYPMARTSKNWQPVNPNAIYIESGKVSDIIVERIEESLRKLLKK